MYTNDAIMEATTNVMDHLLAQNQMLREQNATMHSPFLTAICED